MRRSAGGRMRPPGGSHMCDPLDWERIRDMRDAPKAPAWRRTGANLADAAFFGALFWLARSRGLAREGSAGARLMAVPVEVLREQLRSPGQRLLGTRTVDRRTGTRVALWRTLALGGSRVAAAELT